MCTRCEQLEEEVAYLKNELGQVTDQTVRAWLRRERQLRPQGARLLSVLYHARPRVIDRYRLHEMIGSNADDVHLVNVQASYLRRLLGRDVVISEQGQGYRIGPPGIAVMEEAIAAASVHRGGELSPDERSRAYANGYAEACRRFAELAAVIMPAAREAA